MLAAEDLSGCHLALAFMSSWSSTGLVRREGIRFTMDALSDERLPPRRRRLCTRFVLGALGPPQDPRRRRRDADSELLLAKVQSETAKHSDIFLAKGLVDGWNAEKVFGWFLHAARAAGSLRWVGKADDDCFVQPAALLGMLSRLPSRLMYVGQMFLQPDWRSEGGSPGTPAILAVPPRFSSRSQCARRGTRCCCRISNTPSGSTRAGGGTRRRASATIRSYPCATSTVLAWLWARFERARGKWSPVALLVAQQNVFSFSTRKAGEDPVVGYLAHLVAATYGFNFSLAHLTALHLHDLPGRSILNNWAFPAASIVVHRLKTGQRRGQWEAREQLHNMTTPPDACIPPVVFAWAPRQRDLRCLMPRLWSACLRIGSYRAFGAHHPPPSQQHQAQLCSGEHEDVPTPDLLAAALGDSDGERPRFGFGFSQYVGFSST